MPRLIDGIDVAGRVRVISLDNPEEPELVHYRDIDGVAAELMDGIDFNRMSYEDMRSLAEELGEEITNQIYDGMVAVREDVRDASEIADLVDRALSGEVDWEL
jgi:hypothetical protein